MLYNSEIIIILLFISQRNNALDAENNTKYLAFQNLSKVPSIQNNNNEFRSDYENLNFPSFVHKYIISEGREDLKKSNGEKQNPFDGYKNNWYLVESKNRKATKENLNQNAEGIEYVAALNYK